MLLDIIDASRTIRKIFLLNRPTPPPREGFALACEVHAKYAHTDAPHQRPTFREAWAQSDPSSMTFLSKKKFNDSGTNLLVNKKHMKAEVRRGL